ncbi:PX domain-containing protein [Erysiphe neolycopersici]|uniref:PX domain-containing protein n=1 Tax=Erysiphe neolycopersici TaxID=212602 RepID=A0A420HIF5_9PEZI|nr:PX domain-containing protein [Erysiphe neolycopersici]
MEKNASHTSSEVLTGRQEHYLKRELISQQVKAEITELNCPTALQRFGAPFKSEFGEVSPLDSDLPILRYIFVHFVRKFPFLDHAREKEFWQDKLQVFLQSFASKNISSSEDRLEETKRRKLSIKCQKLVELMMVSGIPTASGYEERIRFSDLEVVDSGAIDHGIMHTLPEGHYVNGWDVNIAGVRTVSGKRKLIHHQHTEFILRVKRKGEPEYFIGKRYGDFDRLYKNIILQLPGKVIPSLPRKKRHNENTSVIVSSLLSGKPENDASSISSMSTEGIPSNASVRSLKVDHRRMTLTSSKISISPRSSTDERLSDKLSNKLSLITSRGTNVSDTTPIEYFREDQRISMRAFLRTLLSNEQISKSKAIHDFLSSNPICLTESDNHDISGRKLLDQLRVEEQKKFYEIARKRAIELDLYMEEFRRNIIESNGLSKLLQEVKDKPSIQDLSFQYRKFAEWLRIEVAATIYHLFLAEDNSPELFAQAKKIHSMIPYTIVKNAIRFANPAAVMSSILDIFLAKPFGTRSLMQRIFALTLNDGIRSLQRNISTINEEIGESVFSEKIKKFCDADESIKIIIRRDSEDDSVDLIIAILRSELIPPRLNPSQISKIFNAYLAWNSAVNNVDEEIKIGALHYSYLKQLLKLYTRQRDKQMMLSMIEEPVTLQLFRDLFTIFYEPLVRVYKTANVYSRVTDLSDFIDDMIVVVDRAREQDFSADPNQTVQAFIDLCARHENNLYGFIHEIHTHDDGLFTQLIDWIESIIDFLRNGPKAGKLDMNSLFAKSTSSGILDKDVAVDEIEKLIAWQEARKKWHQDKTRQKMAADGSSGMVNKVPGTGTFRSSDFGLHQMDLEEMNYDDTDHSSLDEKQDDLSPILAERRLRDHTNQANLRRTAGEPVKPEVTEIGKLRDDFLLMLRSVLSQ